MATPTNTTENVIRRSAQALSLGVSEAEMGEVLINEGMSPEMAYLQVVAARLFARTVNDSSQYTAAED